MAASMSESKQLEDTNILGLPNVHIPQQPNVTRVLSTRDYTLNVNRALRNKINACKEVKVEYELTGGGITGSMDTATFELFRAACRVFYTSFPEDQGYCEINDSDDKNSISSVQTTYKTKRAIESGSTVGYTLNLYPTNNRLLMNGKDLDSFMDCHLPTIHEIMCTPIKTGELRSADQLNLILETQLQSVLSSRQNSVPHIENKPDEHDLVETGTLNDASLDMQCESESRAGPISVKGDKPTPEAKCPGCSKNCLKRGAVCEIGNHWMHYRCDKLSEAEIQRLEKDPGFIYNCKRCQNENTIVKKPVIPIGESSDHENSLDLTKTLTIPSLTHEHSPNNLSTEAAGILEEEVGTLCCVCETRIQDTETTCSKCNNSCHEGCAVSRDGIDQCIACCATDNQLTQEKDMVLDNENGKDKQSNTDTNECRPKVMTPQNMNAKNKGNSLRHGKDTTKVPSVDSIPMKQRELRQMENKLRKWEDDLKMRESRLLEQNKENRRLEDYISKVEARNNEMQHTIRTLQRKISIIEQEKVVNNTGMSMNYSQNHYVGATAQDGDINVKHNYNNQSHSRVANEHSHLSNHDNTDRLVAGVRDQVTSFILNRVSEQISVLESQCNERQPTRMTNRNQFDERQFILHDTSVINPHTVPLVSNTRDRHEVGSHNHQETYKMSHPMNLNCNIQQSEQHLRAGLNSDIGPVQQSQETGSFRVLGHVGMKNFNATTNQHSGYMNEHQTPLNTPNTVSYYQGQPITRVAKPEVNNPPPPFLYQIPPPNIIR